MLDRSAVRWACISIMSAVAMLTTSCSGEEEGVAQPSGSEPTESSARSTPERPVRDPLDISPYLSDPCGLVSPDMLSRLGASPEVAEPVMPEDDDIAAATGPSCNWSSEIEGNFGLGIDSGNKERGLGGLTGLEVSRDQGRYKLWEETSVAGYPAVYYGVRDARSEGDCDLAIGIADDMSIGVTAHSFYDNPQRACDVANEVAADVIQTLKGAR
jgi:hypothetical protein